MRSFFLKIGPQYLICTWFGEDERANIMKTHVLKEIGLRLHILNNFSTFNNQHNWEDLYIQLRMNRHAVPIIVTKAREV